MSVPYEFDFCSNLRSFFMDDWLDYNTHEAIFFGTLNLSSHRLFEPPDENLFLSH